MRRSKRSRSAAARQAARTRMKTQPHAARVRAAERALSNWPWGTVSRDALSRQGKAAAAARSAGSRSRSAAQAVRTKGPRARSAAARKAARTRAGRS
ncbi:MAG TPA: hypothetical protein VKW04_15905 [Planctomycetota bacterium]|nr:hypothetical protein [Planctomycetota bacterium]